MADGPTGTLSAPEHVLPDKQVVQDLEDSEDEDEDGEGGDPGVRGDDQSEAKVRAFLDRKGGAQGKIEVMDSRGSGDSGGSETEDSEMESVADSRSETDSSSQSGD